MDLQTFYHSNPVKFFKFPQNFNRVLKYLQIVVFIYNLQPNCTNFTQWTHTKGLFRCNISRTQKNKACSCCWPEWICRPVVPGGAGGAMAPPNFGRSINPISTKGGRLCPPNDTGTSGFSDLPTALSKIY